MNLGFLFRDNNEDLTQLFIQQHCYMSRRTKNFEVKYAVLTLFIP